MLTENKLLTTAGDVDVGGWNGIGIGGINGGMPGGIKPIGGGIKPTPTKTFITVQIHQSKTLNMYAKSR